MCAVMYDLATKGYMKKTV